MPDLKVRPTADLETADVGRLFRAGFGV